MRILILTFGKSNIWRIGSLQSTIGVPGVEFVGVTAVIKDKGGSSKYHNLSVS